MSKKLVLKKSAADEVKVQIGMEFSRAFKRADEPFTVEARFADAILSGYDDFIEFEEKKPAAKAAAVSRPRKAKSAARTVTTAVETKPANDPAKNADAETTKAADANAQFEPPTE